MLLGSSPNLLGQYNRSPRTLQPGFHGGPAGGVEGLNVELVGTRLPITLLACLPLLLLPAAGRALWPGHGPGLQAITRSTAPPAPPHQAH